MMSSNNNQRQNIIITLWHAILKWMTQARAPIPTTLNYTCLPSQFRSTARVFNMYTNSTQLPVYHIILAEKFLFTDQKHFIKQIGFQFSMY